MVGSSGGGGGGGATSKHNSPPPLRAIAASEVFHKQSLKFAHLRDAMAVGDAAAPRTSSPSVFRPIDSLKTPLSMNELTPIKFWELRLHQVHRGFVVTGKLCVPSFRFDSFTISTLLEDEEGRAIKMNIVIEGDDECIDQVPSGATVAVKEPWFKRFTDGTVGLWVTNPQESLVFLAFSPSTTTSSTTSSRGSGNGNGTSSWKTLQGDYAQLRVRGNRLLSKGDFAGAIDMYSSSIEAIEKLLHRMDVRRKRRDDGGATTTTTMTSVRSTSAGFFNACLNKLLANNMCSSKRQDGTVVTSSNHADIDVPLERERYRSQVVIQGLISAYSNRAEALLRTKSFKSAFEDARSALRLDPYHVKSVFRKGKALHSMGLFKEALACFELAMRLEPDDPELKRALEEGTESEKQSRGEFALGKYLEPEFISATDPSFADFVGPVRVGISALHKAGRGLFVTKDVKAGELLMVCNPIVIARGETSTEELEDLLQRVTACSWNRDRVTACLSYLLGGPKDDMVPSEELVQPPTMVTLFENHEEEHGDAEELRALLRYILQKNIFDEQGFTVRTSRVTTSGCSGVWFLPSFMNHSCYPNVSRIHIGDAMFVRASRDLKAGDEMLHNYVDIICPLSKRREALKRGWGFFCECQRCKLEAKLEARLSGAVELYLDLEELTGTFAGSSCAELLRSGEEIIHAVIKSHCWAEHYAAECQREMANVESCAAGLKKPHERAWLRASYLLLYLMVAAMVPPSPPRLMLDGVLSAVACVSPGDPQVLKLAALLAECGGEDEAAAVMNNICEAMFGEEGGIRAAGIVRACLRDAIC